MKTPFIAATALLAAALPPTLAVGTAQGVDDVNTSRLQRAVTVGGILEHERVFQRIANNNGGTRASGTPGYDASANYVEQRLRKAGYKVQQQEFEFPFFEELAPATLAQTAPTPTDYETATFEYSGSGDVTGNLVPTNDVQVPPGPTPSSSSSGCEPGDFTPASATEDEVALIQRGTCDFVVKANNAAAAGYDAAVLFNEGQPGRTELLLGTLGTPVDIPVVGLTFDDGAALYTATQAGAVEVHVTTSTNSYISTTTNVIADSKKGNKNKVVVVGAHLDSVLEGPGINDNGSGSATILEIAEEMSELKIAPRQQVRFAFWGAEENNLLGSTHYVDTLSDDDLTKIVANLNFDMLGSPNYVRFVYDGDGSDTGVAGPPGSAQIEQIFTEHYADAGLASTPSPFNGRSDYGPFIAVGIPAGGLFSGAEGIKTAEQAAVYGGTAGTAYDPCYHQACDTMLNLNTDALSQMSDAAADAVMTLAKSKTGFFGDGDFKRPAKSTVAKSATKHSPLAKR